MNNKVHLSCAAFFLATVWSVLQPIAVSGQTSPPPVLSITPQSVPEISVQGVSGARYELQYTPSLNTTNWQVLTNFILGTSPHVVVDSNAPVAGIRMYRALLLEANASADYAPTTLMPAEVFRFNSESAGIPATDTLVLNSATDGMFLRQRGAPGGGLPLVTVTYTRLSPFLAELIVIRPPSSGFPSSQTNSYTLVFMGPSSGFFQITDGVSPGVVGEFSLDQSFVGQQLAPVQLTAGERYGLLATNQPGTNQTTLVIDSPASGMLISPGDPPPGSITPVSIAYQQLGPLSSQMQVVIPPTSGFLTARTNFYYLVYAATNAGTFQGITEAAITTQGPFTRDPSLVGQQLAPAQLTAGESYRFTSSNGPSVLVEAMVVTSVTNCILVAEGSSPEAGIFPDVALQYLPLGSLSSHLQLVIPPTPPMTLTPRTNNYLLVYTAGSAGQFQRTSDPTMVSVGEFLRNPAR